MAAGLRGLAQLGADCEKSFTQLLTSLQAILPDLRPHSLNSISISIVSLFRKARGVCDCGSRYCKTKHLDQSVLVLQHDAN